MTKAKDETEFGAKIAPRWSSNEHQATRLTNRYPCPGRHIPHIHRHRLPHDEALAPDRAVKNAQLPVL